MFPRNGDGATKPTRHRRTGGSVTSRPGPHPNSILGTAGCLFSMPAIRSHWLICRFSRTTECEIPPQALFPPGFETKTERGRLSMPSPLGF